MTIIELLTSMIPWRNCDPDEDTHETPHYPPDEDTELPPVDITAQLDAIFASANSTKGVIR